MGGAYWHEIRKGVHTVAFGAVVIVVGFQLLGRYMSYADVLHEASTSIVDLTMNSAMKVGLSKPYTNRNVFEYWLDGADCDENELQAMLTNMQHVPANADAWYLFRRNY